MAAGPITSSLGTEALTESSFSGTTALTVSSSPGTVALIGTTSLGTAVLSGTASSGSGSPPAIPASLSAVSSSKIILPSKRELRVSKLIPNTETFIEIREIMKKWRIICWNRRDQDRFFFHMISQCYIMWHQIGDAAGTGKIDKEYHFNNIYVCKDAALGEIQAVAFVDEDPRQWEVTYIVTHPYNVRSPVNKEITTRVEGAASAIIEHLAIILPRSCKGIYVESTNLAKPFYVKCGFDELDLKEYPLRPGSGSFPMFRIRKEIATAIGNAIA